MGHVDIYPNFEERNINGCSRSLGGSYGRDNCNRVGIKIMLLLLKSNFKMMAKILIIPVGYCHRGRGVSYFTESVKYPDSHQMCQCHSYNEYKSGGCFCSKANSKFYLGEYLTNK